VRAREQRIFHAGGRHRAWWTLHGGSIGDSVTERAMGSSFAAEPSRHKHLLSLA